MREDGEAHAHWLTATKLRPPHLRQDVIPRQRLLSALHGAIVSHPLTLVSAPAGYGKTTLLALLPRISPDLSIAWLSLDQGDNESACFLAALIAALQGANPLCGITAHSLMTSLPNPGAEARRIVGVLINDILETASVPAALILEDLHWITEPSIYTALDYLLERLPSQFHVVVTARHDPPLALARLRARGQLAEFRLANLRFTLDETAAFLNAQLGLGLPLDELVSLHARTEGWPAGLRLLAGSLDQVSTPAARTEFIDNMTQTSHYIFDFLADEVLSRQSPAVRTFLLETSILSELSPAMCQAVTGRSDAAAILERVQRRNLFLVAIDEAGSVYRYHHLFAEFLRRRLATEKPDRVAELHRRAAESEDVPSRRISHYLAAQLWEQAAEDIGKVGEQLVDDGFLGTLRGWIDALPAAVRDVRPRLLYVSGICALRRGALDEALTRLEQARGGFEAGGDEAGVGLCLLELVSVASSRFDYDRQAILIEQALAHPLPPHGRVQLLMARAFQSEYQGNWNGIENDVERAMQIALESGDRRAFNVLASILRLDFTLLPNGTERLERYCEEVLARVGDKVGPVQAGAHSLLGFMHFLRGFFSESVREAERARNMSQQLGGLVYLEVEAGFVVSFTSVVQGDYAAAERYWEGRLPWVEETAALKPFVVPVLFQVGRAQWMQGKLSHARRSYATMCANVHAGELPEATLSRALMGALLEISDGTYASAERILRPAVAVELKMRHCIIIGSARLLLAHVYLQWERPKDALSELAPLLAEFERSETPGWILKEGPKVVAPLLRLAVERDVHRAFARSMLDLLDAAGESKPLRVPDTGETLTSREVQVLRLIATGASNRDIAKQLVISEHTVKVHVTRILDKVGASSRTQAAARARDLLPL